MIDYANYNYAIWIGLDWIGFLDWIWKLDWKFN